MKVLIYKRTHKGDPDQNGIFGIHDCMGSFRNWDYDAVIGIGGESPWKGDEGIKHKINWIGLEPKKIKSTENRGDYVVFSHFKLDEEKGEDVKENYPNLFNYMYVIRKRFDMSSDLHKGVFKEVKQILNTVKKSSRSKEYDIENMTNFETEILEYTAKCKGCFDEKIVEIDNGNC